MVFNPSPFLIDALISDIENMFVDREREKQKKLVTDEDPYIIAFINTDQGDPIVNNQGLTPDALFYSQ